jgi:hypothetical protein
MSFLIRFPYHKGQTDSRESIAHLFDVLLGDGIVNRVEFFTLTKRGKCMKHYVVHTTTEFTSTKCDDLICKIKTQGPVPVVYNRKGNFYKIELHKSYIRFLHVEIPELMAKFPSCPFPNRFTPILDEYTQQQTYEFNILPWHPLKPDNYVIGNVFYPLYGKTDEGRYRFFVDEYEYVHSYYEEDGVYAYHKVGILDVTDDLNRTWNGSIILYQNQNIRYSKV